MRKNVRAEFEMLLRRFRAVKADVENRPPLKKRQRRKSYPDLIGPLADVFDKAGLAVSVQNLWAVAVLMARTLTRKPPGRTKAWDNATLKRVYDEIEKARAKYPDA